MSHFPRHVARLEQTALRGRARYLSRAQGLDFASNDYLGLRGAPAMRDAVQEALSRGVAIGAGGSRLLRGNDPEFAQLEAEAATFFGTESALYMGGGFQANQAIFATLPMAGDLILYDALIHASAHEGMRLSAAQHQSFHHNDVEDAAQKIALWRVAGNLGRIWIAVETLYSMDGDFAPLKDFQSLARQHDAVLILDEAHATGLYGAKGRGLAPEATNYGQITLHTCGKALGTSGALLCADQIVIDTLINRARPFIYATAPSPLMAAVVRRALQLLQTVPAHRVHAQILRNHANACARAIGLEPSQSQIIPVILGADKAATAAAQKLQEAGFDLRAIRPPTVPKGTARLRLSITGGLKTGDIDALFQHLAEILE